MVAPTGWGYIAGVLMVFAGLRRLWVCSRTLPRCLRGDAHFGEAFAVLFPGASSQLHYDYAHYVYPAQMSRIILHVALNQGWLGFWCLLCACFCFAPHRTTYLLCVIPWLYAVSNFVAVDCAPKRNLSTAWSECQVVIISAALTCEAFDTKLNFETSTLEVAVASLVPFAAIAVAAARKTATAEGRQLCGV